MVQETNFFKRITPEYPEIYEGLEKKYGVYRAAARTLVDFAGIQGGETVVDLGCGTGFSSQEIWKNLGEEGKLIGVDVSAVMLAEVRRKFSAFPNTQFIEAEALQLNKALEPLGITGVDVVLSSFTFYHLRGNLPLLFDETVKVLKPQGRFVFNVTAYLTPINFRGQEYNKFAYIFWDEINKVLKEKGYPGKGEYTFDSSLLDNGLKKIRTMLEEAGFSSVSLRLSSLPLTSAQALDFTNEGFYQYGAVPFFATFKDIPLPKRMAIIQEIIERTKQKFASQGITQPPKIFDVLAIKA